MSFGFGFGLARGITKGIAVPDPVLGLSFVGPGPLNPLITFTRASGATVVGNDGYINNVSAGIARFDYDPINLAPLGLLIEQASANSLLYSEQLKQTSAWTATNCGVTSNAASSPFASTKAESLNSSNDTTGYIQQNISAGNATYTFSVFLKANTSSSATLQIYDVTTSTSLATNTIANISSGTPYAGGWYRHSVTTTTAVSGNSTGFRIYPFGAATGGLNKSIYAFGAVAEPGLNFPTSYIRSFGTTGSRVAESAAITGTNFSDWFNGTTGTFYAEAAPITSTPNTYSFILDGYTGTVGGTATIGTGSSTTAFRLDARIGGASNNSTETIPITYIAGGIIKGAVSYDTGAVTYGLVANGTVASPVYSQALSTATSLYIGSRGGGSNFWNGWVRSIRFYNSKLTNIQMQSITA